MAQIDVMNRLPGLRVPTLVLEREDNRTPGPAVARRLHSAIPNADLHLLPGSSPVPLGPGQAQLSRILLAALTAAHPSLPLVADDGTARLPALLTPRELDVLRLVERGLANREIAGVLGITIATVKNHLTAVFAKLRVGNRTAAVVRAREEGLMD